MPGIVLRIVILRSVSDQVSSIRKEHLISVFTKLQFLDNCSIAVWCQTRVASGFPLVLHITRF
jgi:hypothetical protein